MLDLMQLKGARPAKGLRWWEAEGLAPPWTREPVHRARLAALIDRINEFFHCFCQ